MTMTWDPRVEWRQDDREAGCAFVMGDTVRIVPGSYHGATRPETATVIGEGAHPDTFKVVHGGWHMTFHAGELSR